MEAVQSVLAQSISDKLEIILVDNGSSDGSDMMLENHFGNSLKIIRSPVNLGFAGGNNLGFKYAHGEYVLLLNNDAVAEPDWAEALIQMAGSSPDIGMCTSRILCHDNRTIIDNVGHLIFLDGLNRSRGHLTPDTRQFNQVEETLFASGCAGLYRREPVIAFGGFDEDFFAYGDDADLGLKFRLAGYRCFYVPHAVVYHRQSASTSRHSRQKLFWIERNRVWVMIKYFPPSLIIASPWHTVRRLWASWRATRRKTGLVGQLAANHSLVSIAITIVLAWFAALWRLPRMLGKRRQFEKFRKISVVEFKKLINRFGVSVHEMSFG